MGQGRKVKNNASYLYSSDICSLLLINKLSGYGRLFPHFNNDAIKHKDSVIRLRIHNQEGAKDGNRLLRHLLIFILAKLSSVCISYKTKATVGFTQASHRGEGVSLDYVITGQASHQQNVLETEHMD